MKKKRIPGRGRDGRNGMDKDRRKGAKKEGEEGEKLERPKGAKAKSGTMRVFKICEPIGCVRA